MKKIITFILILLCIPTIVYAVPEKPPGEGPEDKKENITYSGANTITFDTNEDGKSFSSTTGGENSLLVSGGNSTLTNCSISKVGDSSGDSADFYGINAAVLTYNGATLNIKGGNITTNGAHANAVFAYTNGTINISDTIVKTTNNNSGAIMVTGGGKLNADNLSVTTDGNSSAPIRSDRGGGEIVVNKGNYTSNGVGSPVIYSTADITVNDANLKATTSEGVVVEGKNKVTLNNVTMDVTNTKLNSNSETYKSIFIYQSMSGDAEDGIATFVSKDSKITNNKGDIIFVTNTTTDITLENNEIINNDKDGVFLKATSSKWGNEGSNGGNITLNMINQNVDGDIIVDDISTLNINMKDKSSLTGAINNENKAKNIELTLSSDSNISLTKDTYINKLNNEKEDNSNIYSNGKYKLYVDGKEVSINDGKYKEQKEEKASDTKEDNTDDYYLYYIIGGMGVALLILSIIIIVRKKRKKYTKNIDY